MPSFQFDAIGTRWQINIAEALAPDAEQALLHAIQERIETFDATYSRFRDGTLVMQMARQAGTYRLPPDGAALMKLYHDMYTITDGACTPLIGQTLEDAGYDAAYSLQAKKLQAPPAWDDVIAYNDCEVTLHRPALLDFGAAGKGYLIDLVGKVLESAGITSFCIDAGGDILQRSAANTPVRIGLEHPEQLSQVIGVATISNASICGSAGNRRKWGAYHHIINPHTLTSPQDILAVWVIAETAMLADALTTCLFFVAPEKIAATYRFSYLMLRADYTIVGSPDFPAELFTA